MKLDKKELIEEEITSCEKSIYRYLDEKTKLLNYQKYLEKHYPITKIYLSQGTIHDFVFTGFQFSLLESSGSKIARYFKSFV